MKSRRRPPGAGALFWLSIITFGIYGVVYVARRWQELFDEVSDLREELGHIRESTTKIEAREDRGR